MSYYLRKHLNISIEERLSLPWWQENLYIECLVYDLSEGKSRIYQPEADASDLSAMGFSVGNASMNSSEGLVNGL